MGGRGANSGSSIEPNSKEAQFIPGEISAADKRAVAKFIKDNLVTGKFDRSIPGTFVTNGKTGEVQGFPEMLPDEAMFEYAYSEMTYEYDMKQRAKKAQVKIMPKVMTVRDQFKSLTKEYEALKKKLDVRNDPRGTSGHHLMADGIPVKGKAQAAELKALKKKLDDADRDYTISRRNAR